MKDPSGKVLVVDDDPIVCRLIREALVAHHLRCHCAYDGREARRLLLTGDYDVIVAEMFLPDGDGLDLLRFISRHALPTRPVCISSVAAAEYGRLARDAGACDFFEKPFDLLLLADAVLRVAVRGEASRPARVGGPPRRRADQGPVDSLAAAALESLHGYRTVLLAGRSAAQDAAKKMLLEFAGALVVAVEAKDLFTRRHSEHVAFYADGIAHHVGLDGDARETIRLAALLHDIGKIAVPDAILTKPGPLSRKEMALIRQHPKVGAGILANISLMSTEAELVRQHHENWDGSGYPAAMSGRDILLGARILNLADSIDAMLMHRTYKDGYSASRMLDELRRCAGTQFDPELARGAVEWCQQNAARLIWPAKISEADTA